MRALPHPRRTFRKRTNAARQVAVIKENQRDIGFLCRVRGDPRNQKAAAHFDDRRRLVADDPRNRTRGQHEPVWPLSRHTGPAQPIAAYPGPVRDGVTGSGDNENLPKLRASLDVARLLDEISAHAATRLAEPLRDVEHTDLGLRPQAVARKLGTAEVEPEGRRSVRRGKERVLYRRLGSGANSHRDVYILATMSDKTRLDKWLWAARFYKTRSLAIAAIENGRVEVNGDKAKPAKALGVGDRVRVRQPPFEVILVVNALSERRGPAAQAATLYEELPESIAARQALAAQLRTELVPSFFNDTPPTEKDRRLLDEWRRRR